MDALKAESVREHLEGCASDRLVQALEVMRDGFVLKRANLRRRYPDETEDQIDARLAAWMADG
jgi:Rv0078B-related antitoxin